MAPSQMEIAMHRFEITVFGLTVRATGLIGILGALAGTSMLLLAAWLGVGFR